MHDTPEMLTIDNGGQFISNDMKSFSKINSITHNKTTSLWSQANGQVERQNRVIKKTMQSAVNEERN